MSLIKVPYPPCAATATSLKNGHKLYLASPAAYLTYLRMLLLSGIRALLGALLWARLLPTTRALPEKAVPSFSASPLQLLQPMVELNTLGPFTSPILQVVGFHLSLSCSECPSPVGFSRAASVARNCFRNLGLNSSRKGHRIDSCHRLFTLNVVTSKFLLKTYVPTA